MKSHSKFSNLARLAACWTGNPLTFLLAVGVVVVWAVSGPLFRFSDTWQLVINTGTTIITFLMVFLIQNSQNRDTIAIHLKLDELIRASNAQNSVIDLENLEEEDLRKLAEKYRRLAAVASGVPPEKECGTGSALEPCPIEK